MTFAQQHKRSAEPSIHLISDADHTGRQAYYFIRVSAAKRTAFLRAIKHVASLNLTDYGEILYSAYGENPPEHIKRMMREQHGWQD